MLDICIARIVTKSWHKFCLLFGFVADLEIFIALWDIFNMILEYKNIIENQDVL